MLDHNLVLKSDELYLVGNMSTDGSNERAAGLYARDTRHLSHFSVTLNGHRPDVLTARVDDATHATVFGANPLLRIEDDHVVLPHKVALEQAITLDHAFRVSFAMTNYSSRALSLLLVIEIAADFRDLFDIRGFPRDRRGTWRRPRMGQREFVLGYTGPDGMGAKSVVSFDRDPRVTLRRMETNANEGLIPILEGTEDLPFEPEVIELPEAMVTFDAELEPLQEWRLNVTVTPVPATGPAIAAETTSRGPCATIATDNVLFNAVLDRCLADLDALETTFPHGVLPAAGIPWFVAPFGRDSLITGLQTLHLAPERAAGTLHVLAALQGTTIDEEREEEPGKILHEMRYGEMARLGEVPHSPYYGSVDAGPLWLWLFAETVAWTGDEGLYRRLRPNAERVLAWIDRFGDRDGDGLIEYSTEAGSGIHITHQVWKDSYDSLHDEDGAPVHGSVTPVEVQGYLFAAADRLAGVAAAMGDGTWAAGLRDRAERVRDSVETCFWLEDEGFYAQALDARKRPVRVLSSNPGHLLACGLPSPQRAARMTACFRRPDLDSGWGIRTLSSTAASYNPMSYHNGSVWPHDNSLIAAGFYRFGEPKAGDAVAAALFDAAMSDPMRRLPELYCGFSRAGRSDAAPVAYPVSCSPQAWAAGSLPLIVRAMLGLDVDLPARRLRVSPALPAWLNELTIRDVCVLGQRGTITVRREAAGYAVDADGVPVQAAELVGG